MTAPNKITLFRLPLEDDFPDPDDLADEVRLTVIHPGDAKTADVERLYRNWAHEAGVR